MDLIQPLRDLIILVCVWMSFGASIPLLAMALMDLVREFVE